MHLVYDWSLMWCDCSQTIKEFPGFGEMHLVYNWSLVWCECGQNSGVPGVWWDAPCLRLKPSVVWVPEKRRNSQGLVRCTLFMIEALCGVSAGKLKDFLGFGEMHLVYDWSLVWCECRQPIGIIRVWWDAPCLWLKPYVVKVPANHRNS